MMSFDALDTYKDKAFTFEVFFRTDVGIFKKTTLVYFISILIFIV